MRQTLLHSWNISNIGAMLWMFEHIPYMEHMWDSTHFYSDTVCFDCLFESDMLDACASCVNGVITAYPLVI